VAAPVQRTPGRRPLPVAVDTHKLRQCLRRTPTVQATDLLDTDRDSGSSSGQPKASTVSGATATPTPAAVSGWGRTAADPQPMLRRHGGTAHVGFARLRWSTGQVDAARGEPLSGCLDTGRGLVNTGSRHAPALRTAAGDGDTAAAARWAAGSGIVHHPAALSDRNGTPMCGTGQHARLTARSVVWGRPET
jgi:hypothetical protein